MNRQFLKCMLPPERSYNLRRARCLLHNMLDLDIAPLVLQILSDEPSMAMVGRGFTAEEATAINDFPRPQ